MPEIYEVPFLTSRQPHVANDLNALASPSHRHPRKPPSSTITTAKMSDISDNESALSFTPSTYSPSPPPPAAAESSPQSRKRKRPAAAAAAATATVTITKKRILTKKSTTTVKAAKKKEESDSELSTPESPESKKPKKAPKPKAPTQKQLDKEMLAKNPHLLKKAVRTVTKTHFIGAHVSAAGGMPPPNTTPLPGYGELD